MAIANLHETLLSYKLRRNQLNLEITQWQSQKTLGTYSQADAQSLKSAETNAGRARNRYIGQSHGHMEAVLTGTAGQQNAEGGTPGAVQKIHQSGIISPLYDSRGKLKEVIEWIPQN